METWFDSVIIQAIVLGVLQGLTEFLPVSSSGHLALCKQVIPGFQEPGMLLDVMLHVGTLAAVLAYYRREIGDLFRVAYELAFRKNAERDPESARLLLGIIIASVPTAIIGLLLEERVEVFSASLWKVGAALVATGVMLIAGKMISERVRQRPGNPGYLSSFLVGIAQGLAVIPGISRSGATISMARGLGTGGTEAARFAFLVSIPAIGGAALLKAVEHMDRIKGFTPEEAAAYIIGPLVAAMVGYAAIAAVMREIREGRFVYYSIYCLVLGLNAIVAGIYLGS
ncbi:MAG: undecaprenyl-diphosphate phosphatase [bacterium]